MGKILVICGATASGKSALAVDCAKKLDGEVISADSQLIYRGLNIGTAKPTVAEMQGITHHMIDIVNPVDNFSVFDYEQCVIPIIERLLAEGKTPIICGGTGFYINSILFHLGYGGAKGDSGLRAKYEKILEDHGKEYLFGLLRTADGATAEKLHMNDTKRVIRALEICELTGRKKSEQRDELIPRYDYMAVAVDYPRAKLYERINCRVDTMFNGGLVAEVKGLLAGGVDEHCQSMQAIGYKEVLDGLKNGMPEVQMREIIKQNTRRYAKRQITFFKRLDRLIWIKSENANADAVMELFNGN